ncbi:MAG: tetratricopeptide repeat protein [Rhodocyclales bacterium]|nr:tetratricopeptide repeat protein [Rhodocyclales bacterium]
MKMHTCLSTAVVLLAFAGIAPPASAMGEDPAPVVKETDFSRGRAAIERKDWNGAIASFEKVVAREDKNADAYNWLGYASRKSGKLDAAFKYYDKALSIDPKHKGAYEYQGEAFLMANQPAKAESNLATLAKLCNSRCEEYQDLKEAVDSYKAGKR